MLLDAHRLGIGFVGQLCNNAADLTVEWGEIQEVQNGHHAIEDGFILKKKKSG